MRVDNARLDWLDNSLPFSNRHQDIYYSRADARGESRHVFVDAAELKKHWDERMQTGSGFVIGELGFGCGLNFLETWRCWRQWRHENPEATNSHLHYIAFEKYPPLAADLARVQARWPELAEFSSALRAGYPEHSAGCHRLLLADGLTLDLHYGDAESTLSQFNAGLSPGVDLWYADGFSPRRNPELWTPSLFQQVAAASRLGSSLSSYSVAGSVRRALTEAGFRVEKRPGFADKKEKLWAGLECPAATAAIPQAWFRFPAPASRPDRVLIIGAGLAGCSLAWALARRGIGVSLLDAATPLSGASGNAQLAMRCRLMANDSALAGFYLHSFLFTRRLLRGLGEQTTSGWHETGLLQFDDAVNKRQPLQAETIASFYDERVVAHLDVKTLSQRLGLDVARAGYLFPGGGWVDPDRLVERLLASGHINLHSHCPVSELEFADGNWNLQHAGETIGSGACVVLTNGADAARFRQTRNLPLQTIRGQATHIKSSIASRRLRGVICGERTVFPAYDDRHTLSASYDHHSQDLSPRAVDDLNNIDKARACLNQEQILSDRVVANRVSLRANTPDHAPLLGPVPDLKCMSRQYAGLARDASTQFDDAGTYFPGLYIHAGHGSNGMTSAPFASEILASLICGEPIPVSQEVMDALNPCRFLIRDLKKQRQPELD